MDLRSRLYLAGLLAASLSYVFTILAFGGEVRVVRWLVFVLGFLLVLGGFEWALEQLESES